MYVPSWHKYKSGDCRKQDIRVTYPFIDNVNWYRGNNGNRLNTFNL